MRRDTPRLGPEVAHLRWALRSDDAVLTTGLVLQELLQGFRSPRAKGAIIDRFSALPLPQPDRTDHVAAADLRNGCRQHGAQIGPIDALLAHLCIRFELTMLTTDADFRRIAEHHPLRVWLPT